MALIETPQVKLKHTVKPPARRGFYTMEDRTLQLANIQEVITLMDSLDLSKQRELIQLIKTGKIWN